MSYRDVRKDYSKHSLEIEECPAHPIELLEAWMQEALKSSQDANAMVLSTVSSSGHPSSRIVLVRQIEERGLSFFTNYNSRKGDEMQANSGVALNFFWPWLERQVRIEGLVNKLTGEESDRYFAGRPRESQLGAWASDQSQELDNRETLEDKLKRVRSEYEGHEVPRPPHWGGYLVTPTRFEFWQGRPSRLHDRVIYSQGTNSDWKLSRLNP